LFALDPGSKEELDAFCEGISKSQADYLRGVVERVLQDPSGMRQPTHHYTRQFHNAGDYVPNLPADLKVWELKTNRFRALFTTAVVKRGKTTHRRLSFLAIGGRGKGRRFLFAEDCPWH
jgi:hypothetical protein